MRPKNENRIFLIRGRRVMLDQDLASIYGVTTKRLNEQVRRNPNRFPSDFVFRLTPEESSLLNMETTTSKWGGRRYQSLAFTEHGAVMLAAVLNSPRAVRASVAIARAFVRFRRLLFGRRELGVHLKELELRVGAHDEEISRLFSMLQDMVEEPPVEKRRIGFQSS